MFSAQPCREPIRQQQRCRLSRAELRSKHWHQTTIQCQCWCALHCTARSNVNTCTQCVVGKLIIHDIGEAHWAGASLHPLGCCMDPDLASHEAPQTCECTLLTPAQAEHIPADMQWECVHTLQQCLRCDQCTCTRWAAGWHCKPVCIKSFANRMQPRETLLHDVWKVGLQRSCSTASKRGRCAGTLSSPRNLPLLVGVWKFLGAHRCRSQVSHVAFACGFQQTGWL